VQVPEIRSIPTYDRGSHRDPGVIPPQWRRYGVQYGVNIMSQRRRYGVMASYGVSRRRRRLASYGYRKRISAESMSISYAIEAATYCYVCGKWRQPVRRQVMSIWRHMASAVKPAGRRYGVAAALTAWRQGAGARQYVIVWRHGARPRRQERSLLCQQRATEVHAATMSRCAGVTASHRQWRSLQWCRERKSH
jgi:hypothetical protein